MSILGATSLSRKQFAAGTWASGEFTNGTATTTTISGSIQSADGKTLQTLPEAERARRARKVLTTSELRVANVENQTSADQVQIDSEWWEVRIVRRVTSLLPHYSATVLALQEAE